MAVEETENAAGDQSPAVTSTRTVDIVVSLILLALAALLAFDNWRTGMSWDASGPQAGYFPFYLSLILGAASIYGLVKGFIEPASEPFVTREQLTPRPADVRADLSVCRGHAVAGALCGELHSHRRLHDADRPHRAVEVTADVGNFHGASCLSRSRSPSTSSCRRARSKPCWATEAARWKHSACWSMASPS